MTCPLRWGLGADGQTDEKIDRQPCTKNQNNEIHNQAHCYEIQVWGFKDSISV